MPELAKAELQQLTPDFKGPDPDARDKTVVVQFNPETLKISFANQIQQPEGGGTDKRGSSSQLFVGSGTTKLTCTLWFDVSAPQTQQPASQANEVNDVRKLTGRVAFFITPVEDKKDPKKFVPPAVRFAWGSLLFDGIMDGLEESLELFSPEGRPLRASVSISMSQQKIIVFKPQDLVPAQKRKPGTTPTTPVPVGAPLQKMAGPNWQSAASANGVENPRLPVPGQRLDLTSSSS